MIPKNLIIFGAGASFGAGSASFGWDTSNPSEKVPALGNALFFDLQRFNPEGWGKLSEEFAHEFKADFEKGIKKLSEESSHFLAPLQRAMAAYFFNFRARTNNLYIRLANKIKAASWDGAIVTLNYERLLEQSLCHVEMRPICGSIPEKPEDIELCFPHGCCHIFCDSVQGSSKGVSFGIGVSTAGKISIIANPQDFFARIQKDAFPPVMSYFEPLKRTATGTNFIESQQSRFQALVDGAENIAIIGIQVRPHDKHIWNPLSKTNAKIIYCSGQAGGEVFDDWTTKERNKKNDIILYKYFADAFDEICGHLEIEYDLVS